jgi:uncharacterized cupin superfamily protein
VDVAPTPPHSSQDDSAQDAPHGSPGEQSRLITADVTRMPLEAGSHPGQWIDAGWPDARTAMLADIGGARLVVWEMTEGVVSDIENDECLLIVSGAGDLRIEGGPSIQLRPGTFLAFRGGERTEWTVTSPLRAVVIRARPGA